MEEVVEGQDEVISGEEEFMAREQNGACVQDPDVVASHQLEGNQHDTMA